MTNLYYMVVRYQAPKSNCLTFTSVGTTSTVYLYNDNNTPNCEYSTDGNTWTTMPTASGNAVSIADRQSIMVRGTNSSGFSKGEWGYSYFVMTGSISASGNIMSLIDGTGESTTIPTEFCFYNLFLGCSSLTSAPELPATTLSYGCYYQMFYGCTSLTSAPQLPATTLTEGCYRAMFRDCTALITAPTLSAMTLADECYGGMFQGCESLTTAPELPATTLTAGCYSNMFSGCTSLTTPPSELPATTLASDCYSSMFENCTSLITAPVLSATALANYCCFSMFRNCTRFKVADSSASGYTLFFTCPSTVSSGAVSGMFYGTSGSYTSDPVANGTYYYYQ